MMSKSLLILGPLVGLLMTSAGCAEHAGYSAGAVGSPHPHRATGRHGTARAAHLALLGLAAAADIAEAIGDSDGDDDNPQREWMTEDGSPPDNEGDVQRLLGPLETFHTVPASADPHPPDKTRPFDLAGVYGEVARVDLETCKASGLATGYGRVVLYFENAGVPASVSIEMPAGSAPEARACVEDAFRKVHVVPFDGAPVNVRRVFYVKA
jgi:hypothetical protein